MFKISPLRVMCMHSFGDAAAVFSFVVFVNASLEFFLPGVFDNNFHSFTG